MAGKGTHRRRPTGGRAEAAALTIESIRVEELYGQFSYMLPQRSDTIEDVSRVFLLYGDNGSGKTTILRLVFHLLSAADNRGHKTAIARVPFRSLSVLLSDGHQLIAERVGDSLEGSYVLRVMRNGDNIATAPMELQPDGTIRRTRDSLDPGASFIQAVSELGLDLYYLSDDRELEGDRIETKRERWMRLREHVVVAADAEPAFMTQPDAVEDAVQRAAEWIRRKAFTGSNVGLANANTIYLDIVRHIVASAGSATESPDLNIKQLIELLQRLGERSSSFAQFGLTSTVPTDALVRQILRASADKHEVIYSVLKPFVDGIEARLAALQQIKDLMSVFVESVNSFYTHKHVEFDVSSGLKIITDRGAVLPPALLSSGERQLLLLFCNTLHTRDRRSIFLIDEPELSLNVKWQRKLIDALLNCAQGSNLQFLMATHSVELLTGHLHNVIRLDATAA